jgi:hypothetical protein
MARPFHTYVPWIALAMALGVAALYLVFQRDRAPETYEDCVTRLSRADDTEATRSLNRAACGNKPKAVEAAEGAVGH